MKQIFTLLIVLSLSIVGYGQTFKNKPAKITGKTKIQSKQIEMRRRNFNRFTLNLPSSLVSEQYF